MAKPIPKWVQERLSKLWKKFDGGDITYKQIEETLKPDKISTIGVFLNELRNAEWIQVKSSEKDARTKIYNIIEPNKILMEIHTK